MVNRYLEYRFFTHITHFSSWSSELSSYSHFFTTVKMYIMGLKDLNMVCRICIEVHSSTKHLSLNKDWYGMSLTQLLFFCFGVKVVEDERLSNIICENCIQELCKVYEFKLRLEKSDDSWKEYLIKRGNSIIKKEEHLITQASEAVTSDNNIIELSPEELNEVEKYFKHAAVDDKVIEIKTQKTYACVQCNTEFVSRVQLMRHKQVFSHYKRKTISCSRCHKLVPVTNYKQHMLKHSFSYTCKICNTKLSNNFNLKRHMLTHTKQKFFACWMCDAKFTREDALKKHTMIHTEEMIFSCDGCNEKFSQFDKLKVHKEKCWKFSGISNSIKYQRLLSCEVCYKTYSSPSSLRTHRLLHSDKCQLCSECGKPFPNEQQLKKHKQTVHNRKVQSSKDFLCNICAKLYSTRTALNNHIQVYHQHQRLFACKICFKTFTQPTSLQVHYIIHTDEKPFVCHICSKAFNKLFNLQRHLKLHSNSRPFKCTICDKTFSSKSSMTIHIRTHTGNKPFGCPDCSKRFVDHGSMTKHRKIHLHTV